MYEQGGSRHQFAPGRADGDSTSPGQAVASVQAPSLTLPKGGGAIRGLIAGG